MNTPVQEALDDAAALVGTRSHTHRGRASAGHIWCTASDRIRIPARPAQYVHRRVPDRRPRTRRSASTSGGGTRDRTIGPADADQPGAHPYLFGTLILDSRGPPNSSPTLLNEIPWVKSQLSIALNNPGNRG
jgi:hypothetical protein